VVPTTVFLASMIFVCCFSYRERRLDGEEALDASIEK
jgi:hypothetical protein